MIAGGSRWSIGSHRGKCCFELATVPPLRDPAHEKTVRKKKAGSLRSGCFVDLALPKLRVSGLQPKALSGAQGALKRTPAGTRAPNWMRANMGLAGIVAVEACYVAKERAAT
jgi:hypothetical protein